MAKLKLDFTGVSDSVAITPGKYLAKVKSITKHEGTEYPYLKWELVILTGSAKGLHINHITSLKPSALFNLRNTLMACGLNVPKAAITLDTEKLIGRKLGIEVNMRERDGKEYPSVKKVFTEAEFSAAPTKDEGVSVSVGDDDDDLLLTDDDL